MLLEEIHFAFVNGIPAEAKEYVEKNRDDYGGFFHVLNYRMSDASIYGPEVYLIEDPFKPGADYFVEELKLSYLLA